MQILILGSDTRDGKNRSTAPPTTQRATGIDVMMLMDISADNKRVSVVNSPATCWWTHPNARTRKPRRIPAQKDVMINAAMSEAGIGCAVDTVNKLTGLAIDHFMMADFNAVKELSNTVGGVDVCISDAVYDPDSQLRLPKGTSRSRASRRWRSCAPGMRLPTAGTSAGSRPGRLPVLLTRKMKDDGTCPTPSRCWRSPTSPPRT